MALMAAKQREVSFVPEAEQEEFPPVTLDLEYRGQNTLPYLMEGYDDFDFVPVTDESIGIKLIGKFRVPVFLVPVRALGGGVRGLNIPELVVLGALRPNSKRVLYGMGQVVETRFGKFVPYVIRLGLGLFPLERAGTPERMVPATNAPNPLA